jgi:apolipoprotein N-acyltransferase
MRHAGNVGSSPDRLSWLWLGVGAVLLPFSTVHAGVPMAAWLAPIFVLRFTRTQTIRVAIPVVLFVNGAALAVAWRDFFPGTPFGLVFGIAYGLWFAIAYVADRLSSPRLTGVTRTLVFPAAVTTLDWAASHVELMGSYGSPAYTQAADLALLQVVSVTGIWGLTFLIHWLAPVANEVWEQPSRPRTLRVSVGIFAAVLVGSVLFGSVRMVFLAPTGPTFRVAALGDTRERYRAVDPAFFVLTPGTPEQRSSFRAQALPLLEELFVRTEQQVRAGAQVVSWFEDAAIILQEDEPAAIARGSELAHNYGIYLELGLLVILPSDQYPFQQNRAILIDPRARWSGRTTKRNPTPGPESAFTAPGNGIVPLTDTPFGRIANVICFDMDFPRLVLQAGQHHADLLIAPSLDWDTARVSHARIATVRAVENGVSLVRATGDGLSQAVDYHGRVLASVDSYADTKAVFVTSVPTQGVPTLYVLIGDGFAYLCALGVVVFACMAIFGRRSPNRLRTAPAPTPS